jgi:hypothetical protein
LQTVKPVSLKENAGSESHERRNLYEQERL